MTDRNHRLKKALSFAMTHMQNLDEAIREVNSLLEDRFPGQMGLYEVRDFMEEYIMNNEDPIDMDDLMQDMIAEIETCIGAQEDD